MKGISNKVGRSRLATGLILACLSLPIVRGQDDPSRENRLKIAAFVDRSNEADPAIVRTALERWAGEVAPDSSYKTTAKIESNRKRWADLTTAGSHDLYCLFAYQFLDLEDEKLLRPSLVTTAGTGSASTFLLLTREEDEIRSMEALRGKKIIVNIGGVGELPLRWLATKIAPHADLQSETPFATIEEVQTASHAFLPVYFGKADACIITRSAYTNASQLNPQLVNKFDETFKSKPLLVSMFAFHRDYSLATAQKISRKALGEDSKRAGQHMLDLVRRNYLAPFDDRQLDSLRSLDRNFKALLGKASGTSTEDKK